MATRRMFRLVEAAGSPHLAPLLELLPAAELGLAPRHDADAAEPGAPEPGAPESGGLEAGTLELGTLETRALEATRDLSPASARPRHTTQLDTRRSTSTRSGAWLVLGWVEGVALPRGPTPWSQVAARLLGLARGLEALHSLGVFHGDVSPANVVLTPTGATVLVDFGAVATYGIGTPGFLAPEVVRGGGGVAADTWSLAAVACWCWLGDVPARDITRLRSRRDVERRLRVLLDAAEHTRDVAERAALRLLSAMLDPDPGARPTMSGVVDALATWASGDAHAAASAEFVVWSRPAAEPDSEPARPVAEPTSRSSAEPASRAEVWPWIGDELDAVVEAAQHGAPLIHVAGGDDDGAGWLLEASITTLTRLGADVERVAMQPTSLLLERWLEAPAGTVLVVSPETRRGAEDPRQTSRDPASHTPSATASSAGEAELAPPASSLIGQATASGVETTTWQILRRGVGVARATLIVSGLAPVGTPEPFATGDAEAATRTTRPHADARATRRQPITEVALRPRSDLELQRLLAMVGVRRRVRPWLVALRALSGGAAGRARRVLAAWIDRQAQTPDSKDVAMQLAAQAATSLSPIDAERVLDVVWGLDEGSLPTTLGTGRVPHDVLLATARSALAMREGACLRSPRAFAAYEELRARGSLVSPSLALDLRPRRADPPFVLADVEADAAADAAADAEADTALLDLDHPAVHVTLVSLLATDDDGAFDPRVNVSMAEATAFDLWAMDCLVSRWSGHEATLPQRSIATFVAAIVALARRRLLAGCPDDALAACVVATAALRRDDLVSMRRVDDLDVALAVEHARALQRLGRVNEATTRLASVVEGLVDDVTERVASDAFDRGGLVSTGERQTRALALIRVAALEARLAVDRGDAITLHTTPSPLRAAAEATLAPLVTLASSRSHAGGLGTLPWRRVCFEYATWSALLALHAGDVVTARVRTAALLHELGLTSPRIASDQSSQPSAKVEASESSETRRALGVGRIARALHVAGNVAQVDGRLHEAARLYAHAAKAFRDGGEDDASALVLASAAGLAWPAGDVDTALTLGKAALRRVLARLATGSTRAGAGVWGMLANLAPALLHTDPGQLAVWIEALDHEAPSTKLEAARRSVFRALRRRLRWLAAQDPLASPLASPRTRDQAAIVPGHAPADTLDSRDADTHENHDADAALIAAQTSLVDCGARDEAVAFALDDVTFALRRGEHDAAVHHLQRAMQWSGAPMRDDVAALLAVARVQVFVRTSDASQTRRRDTPRSSAAVGPHVPPVAAATREGTSATSATGSTDAKGSMHATDPTIVPLDLRAVTSVLSNVKPADVWAAREQRWVALQLRLALHRALQVAMKSTSAPEQSRRLSHALHTSQRQLAQALEEVMTKTPPTDRPTLLRSLALADDEVGWLERLAEGGSAAGAKGGAYGVTEGVTNGDHDGGGPPASRPATRDHDAPNSTDAAPNEGITHPTIGREAARETTQRGRASSDMATTRPGDEETWRARGLAAYRRLAREDQLERVLAQFVDALMELTDAERGLVVLADEGDRLEVARELQGDGAEVQVSRSVVERVLESGEPVLATDAVEDARFGRARSVSHLALRSILAVPLRHRGRVIGAAYVDHRLRRGAFDEASLAGVESFADLASLAIAHARAMALLQARTTSLAAREAELAAALEARDVEVTALRHEAGQGSVLQLGTRALVGASEVMQRVFRLLRRVAASNVPVVIAGESGTGKELVARALHELGPRAKAPFIAENCAAIPESLLESALFGHARGAFTGAVQASPGLFEAASGGTLFLDEITETSLAMQSKLLRVLQEGEVRRIGETASRRVDVRIVVATNRDLERLVAEGKFRQDLYYRLSVVRVDVPALRERVEDIPKLIAYFLQIAAGGAGAEPSLRVSSAAMRRLVAHPWPGNVRELENEVRRWLALVDDVVREDDLSPAILAATGGAPARRELPPGEALVELLSDPAFIEDDADESEPSADAASGRGQAPAKLEDAALDLRTHVERVERALVGEALRRTGNNLTQAAKLLGLSRFGLQKKLRRRDDIREPTLGGEHVARAERGRGSGDLDDGEADDTP